jgi:hypothetical protein
MNQKPRLILPPNIAASRETQRNSEGGDHQEKSPPQKKTLPPELQARVKEVLGRVQELNSEIIPILEMGIAGWIALLSQPAFQKILQDYQDHILPQVMVEICRQDRSQMINVIRQVMENEIASNQVSGGKLDAKTYQKAFSDFQDVAVQLKVPPITFDFNVPQFDLEDSTPSTPAT